MPSQPLQPFAPPTFLLSKLPGQLPVKSVGFWLVALVFAFWVVYTIIALYHWKKYSHASGVALPAILVHLVISLILMTYILSSVSTL